MSEADLIEARHRFHSQKANAKIRGIEWKFSFPEWLEWWGEDYFKRGVHPEDLQMQRFHDKGAYEPGNVRKGHPRENARTAGACKRLANTRLDAEQLANRQSNADSCESKDWRPFSDDEWEIIRATNAGYRQASFLR